MDFDTMVKKYSKYVYTIAFTYLRNHHDSEDVMQEVYESLFKSDPVFQNDIQERMWFSKTTANKSINALKKKNRHPQETLDDELPASCEPEYDDVLMAINSLPEKYKRVVLMFYFDSFSVAEIARSLFISVSSVTTRLSRARDLLKKQLKGDYDYEIPSCAEKTDREH